MDNLFSNANIGECNEKILHISNNFRRKSLFPRVTSDGSIYDALYADVEFEKHSKLACWGLFWRPSWAPKAIWIDLFVIFEVCMATNGPQDRKLTRKKENVKFLGARVEAFSS